MKKEIGRRENILICALNGYRQKLMSSNEVKVLFNLMVQHLEHETEKNMDSGAFGFLLYVICKEHPEIQGYLIKNIYSMLAALQVEGEIDLFHDITAIISEIKG